MRKGQSAGKVQNPRGAENTAVAVASSGTAGIIGIGRFRLVDDSFKSDVRAQREQQGGVAETSAEIRVSIKRREPHPIQRQLKVGKGRGKE